VRLFEALQLSANEVVAVVGSGGKTTIIDQLRMEAPDLALIEVHDEPLPENTTAVVVVAGLDAMGVPPNPILTPEQLASELVDCAEKAPNARVAYVLNKADDELRLQQAKQVSALLTGATAITVDGYVVWPNEEEVGQ
jgi:glycerophosphoryl diester phosphodiesterase